MGRCFIGGHSQEQPHRHSGPSGLLLSPILTGSFSSNLSKSFCPDKSGTGPSANSKPVGWSCHYWWTLTPTKPPLGKGRPKHILPTDRSQGPISFANQAAAGESALKGNPGHHRFLVLPVWLSWGSLSLSGR